MKTALSLILIFSLGTLLSAQQNVTNSSGEQVQITQFIDKANYSFVRKDASGEVLESGSFKGGKPDGIWMNYNPNGTISGKGSYLNGKKEGDWAFYTMQGTPAYTVTFKEGKRINAVQLDERGNTLAETKTKE